MFKKIALYSVLFVVVALSTAAVIVFLNKQPKFVEVDQPVIEQDMTLTNIMNATMSLENYQADIVVSTTDKSVDLSGSLSVLDLATNPSATLSVSGKVSGTNIDARVKFKDNCIYALVNGFGLQIKSKDLLEIFDVTSSLINPAASESFDLTSLLEGLEGLQVDETQDGFNLKLSLDGIGDIFVFANSDYVPTQVHADGINLLGKELSFSLSGQCGGAPMVSISASEQNDYIDLSSCKDLITSAVNSFAKAPVLLSGKVDVFGQSIDVSIFVDQDLNISGHLCLKNLKLDLVYYAEQAYVDICGTKIVCSKEELLQLVAAYIDVDLEGLLNDLEISQDSLSIAGMQLNFSTRDNLIRSVAFENQMLSGVFGVSYMLPSSVAKPQGYDDAITTTELAEIFKDYFAILQSDDLSFTLKGNFGSMNLDLNGYLGLTNGKVGKVYVGNKINNINFHVWNKYNATYLFVDNVKVKFDNSFSSNMIDYLLEKFDIKLPDVNEIIDAFASQMDRLEIGKDGHIKLSLQNGLGFELYDNNGEKYIHVFGSIGEEFDVQVCLLSNKTTFKSAYTQALSPSAYIDLSDFGDMTQSVINTLTSGYSCMNGDLKITGPKGKSTYVSVGIKVETWFKNNQLSFKVTLSNLPTMAILTDLNSTNYKDHVAELTYSGGMINIVRTATRKNGKKEVKLNKNYSVEDLSTDVFFDMLGFDGAFRKILNTKINEGKGDRPLNLNTFATLSKVDSSLVANLKTSKLAKELSDLSLVVGSRDKKLNSVSMAMKIGGLNMSIALQA